VKRWFRTFFVGGLIAYRGLFNWIRPAMYIPTMLGSPLFQLIFFTKLGQFAHAESADFYIVGNAVQVCAMSSVYGMTMAVANERWFGTLGPLLASPANRAAVFLGRGVPVLANGLLVSVFTFGAGALFLGFRPGVDAIPALAVILLVTVGSCTCFGMLLGSIGLRAKDFFGAAFFVFLRAAFLTAFFRAGGRAVFVFAVFLREALRAPSARSTRFVCFRTAPSTAGSASFARSSSRAAVLATVSAMTRRASSAAASSAAPAAMRATLSA